MLLTVVDQMGKKRKIFWKKDAYSGFLRMNTTFNKNIKELFQM